jgi:hypothetical protein
MQRRATKRVILIRVAALAAICSSYKPNAASTGGIPLASGDGFTGNLLASGASYIHVPPALDEHY